MGPKSTSSGKGSKDQESQFTTYQLQVVRSAQLPRTQRDGYFAVVAGLAGDSKQYNLLAELIFK